MTLQHKHAHKMVKSIMRWFWIIDAPITQTLKFIFERYLGNYNKKHILKQDISPTCNLRTFHKNDTCLHLRHMLH